MGKQVIDLGTTRPGRSRLLRSQTRRDSGANTPLVVQSDLSALSWASYKETRAGFTAVTSGNLTVSDAIYNTPQIGSDPDDPDEAGWTLDDIGYNLSFTVPATAWPEARTTYRIIVIMTFTSGDVQTDDYTVRTLNVPTS